MPVKSSLYDMEMGSLSASSHLESREISGNDGDNFYIKDRSRLRKLHYSEVIMVKADSNYSEIYLVEGRCILTSKTLLHWERTMRGGGDIIRIHRSYMVNKEHIIDISRLQTEVTLTGGLKAQFSRRFRAKIKF
jgi:DNA-binding LytR/AlgR family response regulator